MTRTTKTKASTRKKPATSKKKTGKKTASKKTAGKKAASKKTATKKSAAAKKSTAKKAATKKKAAAKKTTTKRPATKKAPAKKATAKKTSSRSTTSKKKVTPKRTTSSRVVVEAPPPEPAGPPELLLRLVALMDDESSARRSAAAVVVGALELDYPEALEALRRASRHADDAPLRRRAVEAIGAIGPATIVEDLMPLLKDSDRDVRVSAKRMLASGRGVTAQDVARMLEARDEKQRLSAIAVLGAMGTGDAREAILGQLPEASVRMLEAIKDAVLPLLEDLEEDDQEETVEQIRASMDYDRCASDSRYAQTVTELLGATRHIQASRVLLNIARSPSDEDARKSALDALRGVIGVRRGNAPIFEKLLAMLLDASTPRGLLGAIVEVLVGLDLPLALEPKVRSLLSASEPPVRRWAIRALGRLDSAPAAKALSEVAFEGDATDRSIALEAVTQTGSGRHALAKRLSSVTDAERAREAVRVLRPHRQSLMQSTLRTLEQAALDAEPDVARLVMELLRQGDGNSAGRVQGNLFDRALKLKRESRYSEAEDILRRIVSSGDADPETRFQLGVCQLLASKRVISRGAKRDPCISTMSGLQGSREFPLLERLQNEPGIGEQELYYLGFSLAEGDAQEQGLGGDILMAIAESGSATKLQRMAKNKLTTMGWLE